MKKPIVIVEDEPDIVELMTIHLEKAGFAVKSFSGGAGFLRFIEKTEPALVVLDLMLPDIDGLEICKTLRRHENLAAVPIIMVTAKGEEMDKVLGLELGADDYMAKPFSPKELVARVKALLRRHGPSEQASKLVEIGGMLTLDLTKYEVTLQGSRIELTSTEFKILELLSSKKGGFFRGIKFLIISGAMKRLLSTARLMCISGICGKSSGMRHSLLKISGVWGTSWKNETIGFC